jgi:hypothetical protein
MTRMHDHLLVCCHNSFTNLGSDWLCPQARLPCQARFPGIPFWSPGAESLPGWQAACQGMIQTAPKCCLIRTERENYIKFIYFIPRYPFLYSQLRVYIRMYQFVFHCDFHYCTTGGCVQSCYLH